MVGGWVIRGSDDEGLALDRHHDRVTVAAGLMEVKLNCCGWVIRRGTKRGAALDQHRGRVKVAAGLVEITLNCGGWVIREGDKEGWGFGSTSRSGQICCSFGGGGGRMGGGGVRLEQVLYFERTFLNRDWDGDRFSSSLPSPFI